MSLFLPILMYHQIGAPAADHKPDLYVPPQNFRDHLECLADHGFHGVGPDAVSAALSGSMEKLPERPILLTFDDADAKSFAPVIEILASSGFPAVAYFVAGDEGTLPHRKDLATYVQAGVTIGSHCLTHRPLTSLSDEAVRAELVESRFRLEAAAGGPVEHLAYPFGSYGRREMLMARDAGYRTAVSTRRGNRHRPSERLCLRRVPIRPDTDCRRLARYLGGIWHWEHVIKERLGIERHNQRRIEP